MISSVGLTAQERGDFDAFLIGISVFLRLRRGGRGAGLHRRLLTRGAGLRLAFGVAVDKEALQLAAIREEQRARAALAGATGRDGATLPRRNETEQGRLVQAHAAHRPGHGHRLVRPRRRPPQPGLRER